MQMLCKLSFLCRRRLQVVDLDLMSPLTHPGSSFMLFISFVLPCVNVLSPDQLAI